MSGSNRRSAQPPINLVIGLSCLALNNQTWRMFRKSITQQTWCFPSFEKWLKCQEHFDPYEKQTEATQNIAKLTLSTKLEPHLQMVTWTVLLAQIQVMRQTANAYPWKIRIKKQWTIVAGNEPANPCCFEVGSFGEKDFVVHMSFKFPVCVLYGFKLRYDMVIRWGQHRELQVVSCNQSTTLRNIYQSWRQQQSSHGYPSVVTKTIMLTHSDSQLILLSTQSHRIIHENKPLPQGATDQRFLESKHPSSVAEKKLCKQAANGGTWIVSIYKAPSSPVVNL